MVKKFFTKIDSIIFLLSVRLEYERKTPNLSNYFLKMPEK